MTGKFIISLDFELMWGVRDKRNIESYGDAILGGRQAIKAMLELFEQNHIQATWATVGLLFAENKQEMLAFAPELKPSYQNSNLSPYQHIKHIGNNEQEDPYHYGYSLIQAINQTPGQEIASHSYGHYYGLEKGQSLQTFTADLQAALNIAKHKGINLQSLVFPRNQMSQALINAAEQLGFTSYRDNPPSFAYRTRAREHEGLLVRGLRFVDSMLRIDGMHSYPIESPSQHTIVNVPASRMLRPAKIGAKKLLSDLQLRRVLNEMTYAAKHQKLYHLWWHPHNFGRYSEENLRNLKKVIQHFKQLEMRYGFYSENMLMANTPKSKT